VEPPESRESDPAEAPGGRRRFGIARSGSGPGAGKGAAYQGAMEAVFSILIGIGAGAWADRHFGTAPWLLALGAAIGFGAFVLRLARMRRLFEDGDTGDGGGDGPPAGGRE
jgi:F0F1-type ATP synthase assembly protein I